jgi:predicted DCC family thiol-disulfide oxidoreductase YuxK
MSDATFVYDDDCGFCTWWAQFFADHSTLEIVGFSAVSDEERERLPDDWEDGAHLLTDEEVYTFGAGVEEALTYTEIGAEYGLGQFVEFLRQFDDYERLRERLYREGADRRDLWGVLVSAEEVPERRD